jgi:hypothetical protein
MKTTNIIQIVGRILLQAFLPIVLAELGIFILLKTSSPELTEDQYITIMSEDVVIKFMVVIGGVIILFGSWFHFISQHRFINRKPKGLYREYIRWFLQTD